MPKIVSSKVVKPQTYQTEDEAGALFDKIEGFAGYGFNKSHSCEYTLISYQAMWLKINYSVEFFAAALSLMDSDKLPALIRSAKVLGIDVNMPDINVSTGRFEIATDVRIVIPFNALKGISDKTTNAIVEARKAGPFLSKVNFLSRVEKRSCNVKHQDILERVGAFSRIETTTLPANHPSRIPDQIELLPGLIEAHVQIDRDMHRDKITKEEIVRITEDYQSAQGVTGANDGMPVKPHFGRAASFMLIQDCPNFEDEQLGTLGKSRSVECIKEAMTEFELEMKDVYWTSLIKRAKAEKQVSPDEIKTYISYLEDEIRVLAPPVIVLMGSVTVRHFLPDLKGKASDHAGEVVYSKLHDANFVIGFNPGELYYAPEKMEQMLMIFDKVGELLE